MTSPQTAAAGWFEFPCTPIQERFFVAAQLAPENASLNIALRWSLRGPIDGEMVSEALRTLVARHEILRTTFEEREHGAVQKVLPEAQLHVPVLDLRLLGAAERERELDRISAEEARRPFDLSRAPLIRAQLLCLGEGDHFLLITAHHLVADGWSMGILARELAMLCNGAITGTTSALPELPIQYSDYAVWQAEITRSAEGDLRDAFWRERLAGFRRFEVPPDLARPPVPTSNSAITSILLTPDLTRGIDALARSRGATWFTTMLTAVLLVLRARTGTNDIAVGTQVAGRELVELEGVVGPFINTLLLRTDFSGIRSFADAIDRVAETMQGALEHSTTPIESVLEIVRPARDPSRHPLFGVNVIQQRAFDEVRCSHLLLQGIPSQSAGALFDLNVFFVERPSEGWRLSCEYNTDLYRRETVVAMLRAAEQLLVRAVEAPEAVLPALAELGRSDASDPRAGEGERERAVPSQGEAVDEIVARLLPLWRAVLNRLTGSSEEGFIDAGGHSLSAFRLITRIEKTFGVRVGIGLFFDNPSVRTLAKAIRRQADPRAPEASVVTLQAKGAATPIFALHNTFLFQGLARRLGEDRPFRAVVPADGVYGDPALSYRDVAAHYVEGIRAAQPHGPYVLLGHCFGSHLAYEAAQQLTQAGEEVSCLVVVDGWAPGHLARKTPFGRLLTNASYRLLRWRIALRKLVTREIGWRRFAEKFRNARGARVPKTARDEEFARIRWLSERLAEHPIKPYDGDILVVRATGEPVGLFLDPTLGWRELAAGRLDVRDTPASHFTMFEENRLGPVVEAVKDTLSRLDRNAARRSAGSSSPR